MRFHVLGPFEVTGEGGDPLPIAGSKERTILAYLVARAGHVVSVGELIDELWGETPPRTAEKTLGSHVSRLRGTLEPDRAAGSASEVILTRGDGYALAVDPDAIDAVHFEHLAGEGRQLVDAGRFDEGGARLEEALELWRGTAYQGLRYTGFGSSEGERLDELRRSSIEDRIDARLATGAGTQLVAELEGGVRDEPLRERRWGQLMLALYRGGRQAEALGAFTRARSVLVDELGIEPGPALKRLQAAILEQDPALDTGWRVTPEEAQLVADVCPYKGLARFESADAGFFFGRERIVAEAIARIVSGRFLALVGPSGSGKSSLMRAGLLHALESGAIPGSAAWTFSLIRPGPHPLDALAGAILGSDGDRSPERIRRAMADVSRNPDRSVLAIDQFEEVFTLCTDAAERGTFLDVIADAALASDGSVTIVLAMRADYYGRCAEHRALASLLEKSQTLVGPMTEDELKRAIELPAERATLQVDPELTDALVGDVAGRAGGLPLLSTALLELWTRRRGRSLVLDEYLRSSGVEGAVGRSAEDAFTRLDHDGQDAARRILTRLAERSEGGEIVGKRTPLDEFDLDHDVDTSNAMDALVAARLVTIAEGSVEVAHEALLREWPRLREWLESDAEGRRIHRRITDSARSWAEEGRDDAGLLRGARLGAALEWADTHAAEPNELERDYLARSRTASEGEVLRMRRTNRLLRGLLAGVAVFLTLSLIIGVVALQQRDDARATATIADARQLAARSLVEEDGVLSLLLARESVDLYDAPETRSALLTSLQREPATLAVMHPSAPVTGDVAKWIRVSPDGRMLAVGGSKPNIDLFDTRTYRRLGTIDIASGTSAGSFSPDSLMLSVATADQRIMGIDVSNQELLAEVSSGSSEIDTIAFRPDGGLLVTGETIDGQGFLVQRDPISLEPIAAPTPAHDLPIESMAFSKDGRTLVTTSLPFIPGTLVPDDVLDQPGETVLWDAHEFRGVRTFRVGGTGLALSPDGDRVAIVRAFGSAPEALGGHLVLLDLLTGDRRRSQRLPSSIGAVTNQDEGAEGVAFSMDGGSVFTTGSHGKILTWDALSLDLRDVFEDPAGLPMSAPVLSSDGGTAFTVDVDRQTVAWDLAGDRRIDRPFVSGSGSEIWGPWFAMSPDGAMLAITEAECRGGSDLECRQPWGGIHLIDTSTLTTVGRIQRPHPRGAWPEGTAFGPDGETLAITSDLGYAQLWDIATREPVRDPLLTGEDFDLWTTAFSPNGAILAIGGTIYSEGRGVVFLFDSGTGEPIGRFPQQEHDVNAVNFTPDGKFLIASTGGGAGGDAVVWSFADQAVVRSIQADESGIYSADISSDGSVLATGGQSSSVQLWDLRTGKSTGPSFNGLLDAPNTVDIAPDGRVVAAASVGQVLVWDVATGQILGRSLPGPRSDEWLAATFAPDGRTLFVVSSTGSGWAWDMDPTSWKARACAIAGRALTPSEWRLFLPSRPYRATCVS